MNVIWSKYVQGIGTLSLDYVIEIRGAKAERNKIFLQIL